MQDDQQTPTGNTYPTIPEPQQPNQLSENRQSAATDMQDETPPAAPDGAQEPTDDQTIEQSADDDVDDDSDDTVTEASVESFPASDPPAWRTHL